MNSVHQWISVTHIKKSISTKLAIAMLAVIILSSCLTGYLIYSHTSRLLQNEIETNLATKSEAIADQAGALFQEKGTLVRQMATNQEIVNYLKTVQIRDHAQSGPLYVSVNTTLNEISATDKTIAFTWIASDRGGFYVGSGGALSKPDYDVKQRPWYAAASKTKDMAYTDPYLDAQTGKLVVSILHPVRDGEALIGFVAIDLFLDTLPQIMESYKPGQSGYTFLLDNNGTIMYHPDKEYVMKRKLGELSGDLGPLAAQLGKNDAGLMFGKDDKGTVAYFGYSTVSLTGWKVVSVMPEAEALAGLRSFAWTTILYFACTTLVLISAVYFLLRYMLRSIPKMSETIEQISHGDLTPTLTVDSQDEVGQVAENLNRMLDAFSVMINRFHLASEQMAGASEQLTASSVESVRASDRIATAVKEMTDGGESQLNSAIETSRAMEEMAIGVQKVAESSSIVAEVSDASVQEIREGRRAIQEAVGQMKSIRESVGQTAQDMQQLYEHSQKITGIIGVIAEISNQTQLLSLNASIEAARAGEHGRGFAVVAGEVKKLAEQSAMSAQGISQLVKDIQLSAQKAAQTMRKGVKDVEQGSEVIDSVSAVFNSIQGTFQAIAVQIQDVTATAQQMAAGTEQVAASMADVVTNHQMHVQHSAGISASAQSQYETMKDISALAESLSKMAEELMHSLSRFKTRPNAAWTGDENSVS